MLRDLNSSDPLHLKYIIKKIKNVAHGDPNLVLETIRDYFVDNLEVGAARAIQGRRGEQRGGLDPKAGSNLGSSRQQRHDLGQVNLMCPMSQGGREDSGRRRVHHPPNCLSVRLL